MTHIQYNGTNNPLNTPENAINWPFKAGLRKGWVCEHE